MERTASELDIPGVTVEQVGMDCLSIIRELNVQIFDEVRIINRLDRRDLILLLAYFEDRPVGFKVGYAEDDVAYYSAKGGVLEPYRRRGIARLLLYEMIDRARQKGYIRFAFDTLPNYHRGMTILGLTEGFHVVDAGYNERFDDYLLRLEKKI